MQRSGAVLRRQPRSLRTCARELIARIEVAERAPLCRTEDQPNDDKG